MSSDADSVGKAGNALSRIYFRRATPTDIPACYEIERNSYPEDEAASKTSLQYRQHHAAPYFRCAVLKKGDSEDGDVVGFICSTRCQVFKSEAMSVHDPSGEFLAIHSVVVGEQYRRNGIATAMMKDYVRAMEEMKRDGVQKLILLAKSHLLGFYVRCGFAAMRASEIEHGSDLWYECERSVGAGKVRLGHPCWVVDSFAEKGGSGNQAGVVLLEESPLTTDISIEWMTTVAKEFNHSETAFVWPLHEQEEEENNGMEAQQKRYAIRYFTRSGAEVDLCGHATLAAGAILFQILPFKAKSGAQVLFSAKKDVLTLRPELKTRNPDGGMKIRMEFPQKLLKDITSPSERSSVLRILKEAFHLENTAENILFMGIDKDDDDLLIELTFECFQDIDSSNINFSALLTWDGYARGVILCCRNPLKSTEARPESEDGSIEEEETDAEPDFFSRFFGPKAGIDEDPVTGSAHCRLGPYFATKLGRTAVVGRQTSSRGGTVECVMHDGGKLDIIGTAITTVSGTLYI